MDDSVSALVDSFVAGWLATEAGGLAKEGRGRKERETELVDRMVRLLSWYVILDLLRESSDSADSSNDEVSRTKWEHILQGTYIRNF